MPHLSGNELALLAILTGAVLALLASRVRADLVALSVLAAMALARIVPLPQILAGFSNPAVVTIAALFVITGALERTGVVERLARSLERLSRGSERRMALLFFAASALLSLGMNNVAVVAVLLPAAVGAARGAGVRESRILMPLAFGTLLGGMATLLTTANLIVNGSLIAQGHRPLSLLDFLPLGLLLTLAGGLYLFTIGMRLLPDRRSLAGSALARTDLMTTYQLAERLWEVRLLPTSPLVRRALAESGIGTRLGVTVLAIVRDRETRLTPEPAERLEAGDTLLVLGREERVRQLELDGAVIGRESDSRGFSARGLPVRLTEALIAPRSSALGRTLKELSFRSKFGLTALALWREGRSFRTDVGDFPLRPGDALLMVGTEEQARLLAGDSDFIVLQAPPRPEEGRRRTRWLAALLTVALLALSAFGVLAASEAMLAGAAAMVLLGCLGMDDVYRAVEWKTLLIIAGLVPLGTALVATGLARDLGAVLSGSLSGSGLLPLVAALFLVTTALTQVVGGQVAALVAAPIAISAAAALGVDPRAVALVVAIACSTAFLTPIAHPVNVLVMGPGGYTARDFLRVGLGLTVVCLVVVLVALPLFWRL